ncbi:hypothetical protein BDD12DRAFT_895135 [Trichophaea hybrida]|nr:hypothetical protein BDD12DRAFT_895135 [Trichophaea hybrida]
MPSFMTSVFSSLLSRLALPAFAASDSKVKATEQVASTDKSAGQSTSNNTTTATTTTTAVDLSAVKALAPNIRHSKGNTGTVALVPTQATSDNLNRGPLPQFLRPIHLCISWTVAFEFFMRQLLNMPGTLLLTEAAHEDFYMGSWIVNFPFEMFVKSLLNLTGFRLFCGPIEFSTHMGLVVRFGQCLLADNQRDVSLSHQFVLMIDNLVGFQAFLQTVLNLSQHRLLCQFPHVDIPRIVITACEDVSNIWEHEEGFLSQVWSPRVEEYSWQFFHYWSRQYEFRWAYWVNEKIAAAEEGRELRNLPDDYHFGFYFDDEIHWDLPVNPDTVVSAHRLEYCEPGMAKEPGDDVWWANFGRPELVEEIEGKSQSQSYFMKESALGDRPASSESQHNCEVPKDDTVDDLIAKIDDYLANCDWDDEI